MNTIKNYVEKLSQTNKHDISILLKQQYDDLTDIMLINDVLILIDELTELTNKIKEEHEEIVKRKRKILYHVHASTPNNIINVVITPMQCGDIDYDCEKMFESLLENFLNNPVWINNKNFNGIDLKINIKNINAEEILKNLISEELFLKYNYELLEKKVPVHKISDKNKNKI